MKKTLFTLMVVTTLTTGCATVSFAAEDVKAASTKESTNVKDKKQELNKLVQEYNLKTLEANTDTTNFMKFESIEEAREFLKRFENQVPKKVNIKKGAAEQLSNVLPSISRGDKNTEQKIYTSQVQYGWPIPYYLNVDVKYTYTTINSYIKSIDNVTSYLSGFHLPLSWQQTDYTKEITGTDNGIKICVKGNLVVGFIINNVPLGYTHPVTYNFEAVGIWNK